MSSSEGTGGAQAEAGSAGSGSTGEAQASTGSVQAEKPFFEITRGNPTPVEVGVLSAIFATAQGNAVASADRPSLDRDSWGSYQDRLRSPFGYSPSSFLNQSQF